MNGYLVMLRHSMDDLPLLLTTDLGVAEAFAARVREEDGQQEQNVLGLDATTPLNVSIYQFAGGRLVGCRVVKEFSAVDVK